MKMIKGVPKKRVWGCGFGCVCVCGKNLGYFFILAVLVSKKFVDVHAC